MCAVSQKTVKLMRLNLSSVIPINKATNGSVNLKADRHHKLTIKQKNVIRRGKSVIAGIQFTDNNPFRSTDVNNF